MNTTKLFAPALAVCWIIGSGSACFVSAQDKVPDPANAAIFQRPVPEKLMPGGWVNARTNITGLVQGIQAIQHVGEFMLKVDDLQTQGFINGPIANSLDRSAWSMIASIVTALSGAADCGSVADLSEKVNATGLSQNRKAQLLRSLGEVQEDLDRANAALKAGNSRDALRAQFAAIRQLAEFIEKVDQFEHQGLIDRLTADALEKCAMHLVGTVNVDLSAGLVAWYPFDGDANDASGQGNNGTVIGASFQTYGTGTNLALRVNGNISSCVFVPRSVSLEPVQAISISMWVKGLPGEPCGQGWGTILRKADNCEPGYFIRGCNGGPVFELDGATPCWSPSYQGYAGLLPFTGTNWQHIAGTYSYADGSMKSYDDGVLVSQTPLASQLLHSGNLYIGGAAVAGDDGGFNGLINDVRIYNRALSAAEVQQLYLSGSASHP